MYDMEKRDRMEAHPAAGTKDAFQKEAKKRGTSLAKLVAAVLEEKAQEWSKKK